MQEPHVSDEDLARAPCLVDGPLAASGRALVAAGNQLGTSRVAGALRALGVCHLFAQQEAIFARTEDPAPALAKALGTWADFLATARQTGLDAELGQPGTESPPEAVEVHTGEHYGRLFSGFSPEAYFAEAKELLDTRLKRNSIDLLNLGQARVLDAGCGGGRYSVAWRALGAGQVVGYDISDVGLNDARERVRIAGIDGVEYQKGSVLDLPFEDDAFDIVFSNGVLHHTPDWQTGVHELVRVLKPGGLGWLYLIEDPGGLFWDLIEILRCLTATDDKAVARDALKAVGVPGNRIFYMLDHVMVPINERLTPAAIEDCLKQAGATGIRRLERGTDFDRVEQIHAQAPYAAMKFGVGENRHIFTKD